MDPVIAVGSGELPLIAGRSTSANRPTEHQQTGGGDPASRDANSDSCPLHSQLSHERGSKGDKNKNRGSQSNDSDDRKSRVTHPCPVQVAVNKPEQRGQS